MVNRHINNSRGFRKLSMFCFLFLAFGPLALSQNQNQIIIEGYVYEANNRGFLNFVELTFFTPNSEVPITKAYSNKEGYFTTDLPVGEMYIVRAVKDGFVSTTSEFDTKNPNKGKVYIKVELDRKPGYIFDVTLARERSDDTTATSGIHGALIEVFNNTTGESDLVLDDYEYPNFKISFEDGNHYTILVRKEGFYSKRMEAYVNVKGCILCFEGVGDVQPGVSDVLTSGHKMGTLLANVEMKPIELGEKFKLENIYYDLDKADLRDEAKEELGKVINIIKDNPGIKVELGSHTDSRGRDEYNMTLSERRAKAARDYIMKKGEIDASIISGRGYGESLLVNQCGNDVNCSEAKHQDNRRTEIKILDFRQPIKSRWVSLAEEKRLAKMDEMLANIQSEGEVMFTSTDEIPEDLRKQLEKEENAKKGKESDGEDSVEINEDDVKESPSVTEDQGTIQSTKKTEGNEASIKESGDNSAPKIQAFDTSYSGFLIQLLTSSGVVNATSMQKLVELKNVVAEKRPNGATSYLYGYFDKKDDATKIKNIILKEEYPDAFIVEYKDGKRL